MIASMTRMLNGLRGQLIEMTPLVVGVALLTLAARYCAGDAAIALWDPSRFSLMLLVLQSFVLTLGVALPLVSVARARDFVLADSGQVDIKSLWRSLGINPVVTGLGIMIAIYGMTAMGSLVEMYRLRAGVWHDATLWSLESAWIHALLDSPFNVPAFWDVVYMAFWGGLLLMIGMLQGIGRFRAVHELLLAAVVAFFLTRIFAIYWPTAGPMFYVPGLFDLSGTSSGTARDILVLYMEGGVPQTGWLPGTMAMPSLHVGVTGLAAWYLGRQCKWSYWLSMPWLILIWSSTVFLGWHYILDGVGGLLVAAISGVVASRFSGFVSVLIRRIELGLA